MAVFAFFIAWDRVWLDWINRRHGLEMAFFEPKRLKQ
jgi:hypothetical protein